MLNAATKNPADYVGWASVGRLQAGNRADMVVLGGDLRVKKVMRGGEWVA